MRSSLLLAGSVVTAAIIATACGSNGSDSNFNNGSSGAPGTSSGSQGQFTPGGGTSSGDNGGVTGKDVDATTLRIDPADAVLTMQAGQTVTQPYKVFGKLVGDTTEQDLTSRVVFYVPDNYLVGGFPLNGGPLFSSRLPALPTDPPQRGGKLTVQASAQNTGGIVKVTTSLTIKLDATLTSPNVTPALPADPGGKFSGLSIPGRAPQLAYPNDGTMLPPNLRRLEVHWMPGNASNQLYEISFKSSLAEIVYYSRCGGGAGFVANACAFELDGTGYEYLAESNAGAGDVKLKIRGTDDAGATGFGESAEFTIQFAQNRVDGGLYYWTVSEPQAVMRFDFGAASGNPEQFVVKNQNGVPNTCPGCHALSHDGKKLVGSMGGQWDGRLLFINDISKEKTDPTWLTVAPEGTDSDLNRIQFASFNPDSSKFVAVYGDQANVGAGAPNALQGTPVPTDLNVNNLWFHDGNTGLRLTKKTLAFKPDHPDWSPDGQMIAIDHVANAATTTQRPKRTSIELLKAVGPDFADPVPLVPQLQDHARYNPNFVPDSTFLYFSESICVGNWDSDDCDGDADPGAKTWVVQPIPGSAPILLANAGKPGVADNSSTNLGDTFPRSAPFQTVHQNGKLFWFTVASRRSIGLRTVGGAQHLWMFAVDPSKVMAGTDGSFTGFYLPFQDLQTSNHIAQWTEKVVGGSQPPPEPPPPPPPAPAPPITK